MSGNGIHQAAMDALRSCSVFDPLPDDAISELAGYARREVFDVSTLLVNAGERPTALRYVQQGHIVARATTNGGLEAELIPIFSGEFSTWLGTFTDRPMVQDYWSSADAVLLAFPNSKVTEICDRYPLVYKQVLKHVARRFQTVLRWVWDSNLADSEVRLARQLLALSRISKPGPDIQIPMSQEALAKTLGWSRQTLNRQLRQLESMGLVQIGYKQLTIPNIQKLAAFSDYANFVTA